MRERYAAGDYLARAVAGVRSVPRKGGQPQRTAVALRCPNCQHSPDSYVVSLSDEDSTHDRCTSCGFRGDPLPGSGYTVAQLAAFDEHDLARLLSEVPATEVHDASATRPATEGHEGLAGGSATEGHDRSAEALAAEGHRFSEDNLLGKGNLAGAQLEDWGRSRLAADAFSRSIGAGVALGLTFKCPVPGHPGHAAFFEDKRTGLWKLHCFCGSPETHRYLTIAEVRASIGYGKLTLFDRRNQDARSGQAPVWYRRVWHEAGLLEPVAVALPEVELSSVQAKVRDGFALLVGLRWCTTPGGRVMFERTFAAAWCGDMSPGQARHAIGALIERGVIVVAGELDVGKRSRAKLYLPRPVS